MDDRIHKIWQGSYLLKAYPNSRSEQMPCCVLRCFAVYKVAFISRRHNIMSCHVMSCPSLRAIQHNGLISPLSGLLAPPCPHGWGLQCNRNWKLSQHACTYRHTYVHTVAIALPSYIHANVCPFWKLTLFQSHTYATHIHILRTFPKIYQLFNPDVPTYSFPVPPPPVMQWTPVVTHNSKQWI